MPRHNQRIEPLIFNYETTSKTDFRDGEIKPIITTVYKTKPARSRPKAKPVKDLHSMTEWRIANIPFDLYHKPKDIVGTHPSHTQKVYKKPQDVEREHVQKTRPRVLITPALIMDDIMDPSARKDVVDEFYTTSTQRGLRGVQQAESIKAPLVDHFAPAQPITIQPMLLPYVSPQWRMESAGWDERQLRTATCPTKHFWLHRTHRPEICETSTSNENNE